MQDQRYVITDKVTGEVDYTNRLPAEYEPQDTELVDLDQDLVLQFLQGKTPFHLQKLQEKSLSPDEEEYQYGVIAGGPATDFAPYVNKKVVIIGGAIIPHPPYKAIADKDNPDAPLRPGYLKCCFALDQKDQDGNHIIIQSSGVNVFEHALNMFNAYGWWLWDKPREYMITRGGKANAYFMRATQRPPTKTPPVKVTESK